MKSNKFLEKNKTIFWDYNIKKMDLENPEVKIWYLNRKLKFGDLRGLKKLTLKSIFFKLNIDSSLRELLSNYFAKNAQHKIKTNKIAERYFIFLGRNSFGKNFYWAGETLLFYQYLHHRDSIDLDFFPMNCFQMMSI